MLKFFLFGLGCILIFEGLFYFFFANKIKTIIQLVNYSNTENYLSIYENVRIDYIKGNLIADKLLFDIKKQNLAITSFNDGKINANIKLNEKRF